MCNVLVGICSTEKSEYICFHFFVSSLLIVDEVNVYEASERRAVHVI